MNANRQPAKNGTLTGVPVLAATSTPVLSTSITGVLPSARPGGLVMMLGVVSAM